MADKLSELVLERIFQYLSVGDLLKCSRVCQRWHRLLGQENSAVWQSRFYESGNNQFRNSKHLNELDTYKAKVLCYQCAWNDKDKSPNIYIKEDCLTLHRNPMAQSSDLEASQKQKWDFTQARTTSLSYSMGLASGLRRWWAFARSARSMPPCTATGTPLCWAATGAVGHGTCPRNV